MIEDFLIGVGLVIGSYVVLVMVIYGLAKFITWLEDC
jgi:hypothetical protein